MQRPIISFAVLTGCLAASASAIPPPPPAQSGSKVSRFDCDAETVVITERWDYSQGRKHKYTVSVGSRPLVRADAEKLNLAIEERGPFQAASVYCLSGRLYQLALHRYVPRPDHLRIYFDGPRIRSIGREPPLPEAGDGMEQRPGATG